MATNKQIALIKELLDELNMDRGDLACVEESWEKFEDLHPADASELIDYLIEEKLERRGGEREWD